MARAASFNTHLADLLVLTGYCALHTGQLSRAAALATEARALSMAEDCGYRWGDGDAAHLLAEAELQRGHVSAAVLEAEEAARIREAIGDPKLENTHSLIERARRRADLGSNR